VSELNTLVLFANQLRPHEASVGLALLELVRGADERGVADRSDWLTAVRHAYGLAMSRGGVFGAGAPDPIPAEELPRYLQEHVLARLASVGIAVAEPDAHDWDRVRFTPQLWAELESRRHEVAGALEDAVRNLLEEGRRLTAGPPLEETTERVSGSTLEARRLVKVYRKRKVVNEVDVQVSQGEIVGLLGPNGAGKTTTFYVMVGLIQPNGGEVFLDDEELTSVPMFRRARKGIGYLAQEPSVFRRLTVQENILAILETMPLPRAERKARLERLLDELGLKHLRNARAYSLSGGERRRLEITRALVSEPKFMLLDEPFAGVDPIAVHDIQQIVAGLRHRGIGVIITDHNVEQTLDIIDRAYIMYDGRVRVSGTVQELVWNDEVAEFYFGPTLTARMRERYRRPELVV
jgi:lipopolysaccharide export system ATP-binding protein